MFGLSFTELVFIFFVALLIFGPRKLPEIGRTLGKMMNQFRQASNEFKRAWEAEVDLESTRQALQVVKDPIGSIVPAVTASLTAPLGSKPAVSLAKAESSGPTDPPPPTIEEFIPPAPEISASPVAVSRGRSAASVASRPTPSPQPTISPVIEGFEG
ncbi:MAG: twin-arginine translocase TatA/TatE family subunit [Acidobacteria bacterium]|nr:twin-arginine translocase TatA/TatE family subunit [Acidobacteriota bacterium]